MSEKDLERIKNIYGKRNPKTHIEQRCQRLYTKQLDGLSTRQLVLQHAQRESISEKTAWVFKVLLKRFWLYFSYF